MSATHFTAVQDISLSFYFTQLIGDIQLFALVLYCTIQIWKSPSLSRSLSRSLTHSLRVWGKWRERKLQWRKKLIFCFYVSVFGCASANVSKIRCAHWAAVASAFAYIHPNVWECDPVRKLHAQRTASTCPRGHRRTASWMKHWWKWWQLWCSLSSVTLKEEWIF